MTSDFLKHSSESQIKRSAGLITKRLHEGTKREKGYLYFIGKDGYLWAAPMKHNKTGVKKRVGTYKITEKEQEILEYSAHLR